MFQTLVLIFFSIVVLLGGVVLLTLKKPAPAPGSDNQANNVSVPPARNRLRNLRTGGNDGDENHEGVALRPRRSTEGETVWELGDASDSDEDDRETDKGVERTPQSIDPHRGYPGRDEDQSLVEPGEDSDSDDFGEFTTSKRT